MNEKLVRRDLFRLGATAGIAGGLLGGIPTADADAPPSLPATTPWPGFPRQESKLVAEVVGASHSNEARVKELVKAHPALVNAWWDWGFGDWESPLGAASHTGQRGIAEFLLAHGARIDIFAAAMLGMTDTVKAFVAAQPGVQRTLGPHGITLLAHAKVGGKRAADTAAYLESLGDAGIGLKVTPLAADRRERYVGKFVSEGGGPRLEVKANKAGLLVVEVQVGKEKPSPQRIHYLGDDTFFPSGVPSVRIQFALADGKAASVTIRANDPILTAKRVGG